MKCANDFTVCVARTHERFLNVDNRMFKKVRRNVWNFLKLCSHIHGYGYDNAEYVIRSDNWG